MTLPHDPITGMSPAPWLNKKARGEAFRPIVNGSARAAVARRTNRATARPVVIQSATDDPARSGRGATPSAVHVGERRGGTVMW